MTDSQKKEYTLRISQANSVELLIVLYEMLETYIADAISEGSDTTYLDSWEPGTEPPVKGEAMHESIRKARACLNQLIDTLNMDYELSARLLSIYSYISREMARADIRRDPEPLRVCAELIALLREGYESIKDQDETGSVMENSQQVYAGLTYGKGTLSENITTDSNRGFLV